MALEEGGGELRGAGPGPPNASPSQHPPPRLRPRRAQRRCGSRRERGGRAKTGMETGMDRGGRSIAPTPPRVGMGRDGLGYHRGMKAWERGAGRDADPHTCMPPAGGGGRKRGDHPAPQIHPPQIPPPPRDAAAGGCCHHPPSSSSSEHPDKGPPPLDTPRVSPHLPPAPPSPRTPPGIQSLQINKEETPKARADAPTISFYCPINWFYINNR